MAGAELEAAAGQRLRVDSYCPMVIIKAIIAKLNQLLSVESSLTTAGSQISFVDRGRSISLGRL